MEETKILTSSVFDALGGNIEDEIKEYPIEELGLLTTENSGKRIYNKCTENIYRILTRHPYFEGRLRFDQWKDKAEILEGKEWRDLRDSDYVPIQRKITSMYPQFRNVGKDMVVDAINDACRDNSYDSAVNFVRSVEWDKKDRLSTWLSQVYGVEQNDYHKAVGENFFKGMVKRIIQPGCKFDSVLILEGPQGCGKSTSLTLIAGDWHLETTMKADRSDFFLQFKGKLIVEFSEGETLSRTETKQMKAIISTQVDTYRAPYGRLMQDIPRRCVFAMTTNNDEYLKDETGNRRFFPVEVVSNPVNLEWLNENRMQLFAEALYRVETMKETVHEYPKDAADAIRGEKMVKTGLEDIVLEWIGHPIGINGVAMDLKNDGVTTTDVWVHALNGSKDRFSKYDEMRVAQTLRVMGLEKRRTMVNGEQKMRWFLTT
jgi:putative DNA primase/helicase